MTIDEKVRNAERWKTIGAYAYATASIAIRIGTVAWALNMLRDDIPYTMSRPPTAEVPYKK